MPTLPTRQCDWTAGEWSPLLSEGRVDLEKFYRSARRMENMRVLQAGGAKRRWGTRYVATALGPAFLMRWEFSRTDSYILCFTDTKLQFFRNGGQIAVGGVPVAVTTPYAFADVPAIDVVQSGDALILVHPTYPVQRLDRLANDIWRIGALVFDVPPSVEYGVRTWADLTPGAVSGAGVTFTAGIPIFLPSDVGRSIEVKAGVSIGAKALITSITDQTHAVATITAVFANTAAIAHGSWRITGSPQTTCTPSAKSPVGASVSLTLAVDGFNGALNADYTARWALVDGGCFQITSWSSPSVAGAIIRSEASSVVAAPAGAWTLEEDAFSALNGYPCAVTFMGDRLGLFGPTTAPDHMYLSKTGDYFNFAIGALADDAISVAFRKQPIVWARGRRRLLVGTLGEEIVVDPGDGKVLTPDNTPFSPRTEYGSSAVTKPIGVGEITLFVDRAGRKLRELVFQFQIDDYVAPDLALLAEHITKPVRIGGTILKRGFLQLAYQRSPDSTLWATRQDGVLLGMTYLRDQNIVGWHRHVTGTALTGPEAAGHQYPALNDGFVESVAVVPHPEADRDQVWLAVRRTVGGVVKHYIEYFDDTGTVYDQLQVDAALTYDGTGLVTLTPAAVSGSGVQFTAGAAAFALTDVGKEIRSTTPNANGALPRAMITAFFDTTHVTARITEPFPSTATIPAGGWGLAAFTFSGLSHLEGKTVAILGDGAVYAQQAVTAGLIILDYPAMLVEIGLPYVSTLVPNRPEVAYGGSTLQGFKTRIAKATVRVSDSLGGIINGTTEPIRTPADLMGQIPALKSEDLVLENLADDIDQPYLVIQQAQPLPLTVILVSLLLNTED